jgi:hypothetical protein
MTTTFNRLTRIADWLGEVEVGSPEADHIVHEALGRSGPLLAYTRDEGAARLLLQPSFEWRDSIYSNGLVYASCRRMGMDGEWPHPHHGQWGAAVALAMCGAVVRAQAVLVKG